MEAVASSTAGRGGDAALLLCCCGNCRGFSPPNSQAAKISAFVAAISPAQRQRLPKLDCDP
jgi:hypothetical protein